MIGKTEKNAMFLGSGRIVINWREKFARAYGKKRVRKIVFFWQMFRRPEKLFAERAAPAA